MLNAHQITLQLTGSGTTQAEAVSKAVASIQKEIFKQLDILVIRAEPESFTIVQAEFYEYTERFLFLFLPRTKRKYNVTLNAIVNVKTIDPKEIQWKKNNTKSL